MKSSIVHNKEYVTMSLVNKENGFRKDTTVQANALWEKAVNNLYIDTKEFL